MSQQFIQTYSIPASIVIGAAIVAAAIFASSENSPTAGRGAHNDAGCIIPTAEAASPTRAENRALYGAADAPTTIVEFSDYQCPYCARLHPTIKQIVDESDGQINWEFRHLPLPFHTSAEYAAMVSECVHYTLGVEAFWEFGDLVFANQRAVNPETLRGMGQQLGLTEADIAACESDEAITAQIEADMIAAQALGGRGTPYSVIVFPDDTIRPVSGALPYTQWIQLLEV